MERGIGLWTSVDEGEEPRTEDDWLGGDQDVKEGLRLAERVERWSIEGTGSPEEGIVGDAIRLRRLLGTRFDMEPVAVSANEDNGNTVVAVVYKSEETALRLLFWLLKSCMSEEAKFGLLIGWLNIGEALGFINGFEE